ncbi:hypothetical protein [Geodermatophilus ruber]|uniref:Gram-positive cocci surface proteins LPxTG domain-containing protein n=1 Tax=Geodermatophilus ruber TaxID=504800 RepID=A0A1I4IQP0_9ACTN|nr:hypothetical protein [Geodermatophilus ruber]SFL56630.1 hypothetical protein SAMN04488085_11389 [Geodermatophilus ruber]
MSTHRSSSRGLRARRSLVAAGVAAAVVALPGPAGADDGGAPDPGPALGDVAGELDGAIGLLPAPWSAPTAGDPDAEPAGPVEERTGPGSAPATGAGAAPAPPAPGEVPLVEELLAGVHISPECVDGVLQGVRVAATGLSAGLQELLDQLVGGLQQGPAGLGDLVPLTGDGTTLLPAPTRSASGTGTVVLGSPEDLAGAPGAEELQRLADDLQALVEVVVYDCLPQPPGSPPAPPEAAPPVTGAPPAVEAPPAHEVVQPTVAAAPVVYPGYAPTGADGTDGTGAPAALGAAVLLAAGTGLAGVRRHSRAHR